VGFKVKLALGKVATLTHGLTRAALNFSAAGLVLMTLIIGWQVFARYVLNASPAWSETAALLLMLYYIMLAAAVGVYEGFHLGLRWLLERAPENVRYVLEIVDHSFIILFGVVMLASSVRLAQFTADHTIPTLNISRATAYWPFAAAGLLISIFALEKLLVAVSARSK
jgi:TRAP-type C4-dicarboxylate transport system permease small subunit